MKISLLLTGSTADRHLETLMQKYISRIKKYCNFYVFSTRDARGDSVQRLHQETDEQKKFLSQGDYAVLLDEKGALMTSAEFAAFIGQKARENRKHLVFMIGGAYGFSDEVRQMGRETISLSPMTLPHQLVRLFFLEQLYRAFTIIRNEPYQH